ncbi:MAG TPA: UDP-N-acetylmuramate--L-alanine ligase [Aquifex sp.]|nr:UDP-N-acetylmuramate--L-alanine ligase [Aquifex sp.]
MFKEKIRHFHLVGIGGIGMSGIAHILLDMGYKVSGSDLNENKNVQILRERGAKIFIGHRRENLPTSADVLVYSSAVSSEKNPEILEAKRRGIPVIPRGEMLAELMRVKEGIAVSGSHGKTTTTSMVAHIFYKAGLDPTVIIGGKLHLFSGQNARLGKGEILIAEADESDGSFLKLSPVVAVVTNIDKEHLDYYRSFEKIKNSFLEFLNKVPFYGFSVVNIDDISVREIFPKITRKVVSYGINYPADYRGRDIRKTSDGYLFSVETPRYILKDLKLNLLGRHNIYNALASVAVAMESGISPEVIKEALEEFRNAEKRLELLSKTEKVIFYEDYAHHPREIDAIFKALKEFYPDREIIFVFQPHRYTRTFYLWEEFVKVLKPFKGIITEIYPAGEEPIPNVNAERLAKDSSSLYGADENEVENLLSFLIKDGEPKVVIFLGAGSIGRWAKEIASKLSLHR